MGLRMLSDIDRAIEAAQEREARSGALDANELAICKALKITPANYEATKARRATASRDQSPADELARMLAVPTPDAETLRMLRNTREQFEATALRNAQAFAERNGLSMSSERAYPAPPLASPYTPTAPAFEPTLGLGPESQAFLRTATPTQRQAFFTALGRPDPDAARQRLAETDDSNLLGHSMRIRSVAQTKRSVSVIASTDSIDSYGEIVQQSWKLGRYLANPVVLYAHNRYNAMPIGYASDVAVVDGKLCATLNFVDANANPQAETVWQSIQQGSLRAVSVGFMPGTVRLEKRADREVYVLSDNELHEISVVPVPANPDAMIRLLGYASSAELDSEIRTKGRATRRGES